MMNHSELNESSHRTRCPFLFAIVPMLLSVNHAFAAQYLNSGIFPNGSSAGLVSRFAAAST